MGVTRKFTSNNKTKYKDMFIIIKLQTKKFSGMRIPYDIDSSWLLTGFLFHHY